MPRNGSSNTKFWTGTFLIMTFMLFLSKYRFLNLPVSEYIVHVGQMMYLIYILCFSPLFLLLIIVSLWPLATHRGRICDVCEWLAQGSGWFFRCVLSNGKR